MTFQEGIWELNTMTLILGRTQNSYTTLTAKVTSLKLLNLEAVTARQGISVDLPSGMMTVTKLSQDSG